ncbi:MAG: TonB-dependent receptor plug domain-containing protein [Janthinobacterium lividum]
MNQSTSRRNPLQQTSLQTACFLAIALLLNEAGHAQTTMPDSANTLSATSSSTDTGSSLPATTNTGSSTSATQLQRVEVTGSLIRSSDKIGYNQVQTVTAKDIQETGATTVSEFLRSSAANSASSWDESASNSFAPGGAGIALRGLSEKYTLVLVDGIRVAPYGLAVNATDSFFDLNSIPLNMVDRIEIVKTGAVSQYGSDAIAGVVNIITKKNFKGLQVDGSYGTSTHGDGGKKKFSVLGGFGDLNSDRFNVTASASYYKSDNVSAADRDMTAAQDFSNYPGGRLNLASGGYLNPVGTSTYSALATCPSGTTSTARGLLSSGGRGTTCAYDQASGYSLLPESERLSAKVHATFKVSDDIEAFADVWGSRNTTQLNEGYSTLTSAASYWDKSTQSLANFSNILSGSNIYNSTGVDSHLRYAFRGAPDTVTSTANWFRAATGLKGTVSTGNIGWDWAAVVSHSQSTVNVTNDNLLSVTGVTSALSSAGTFNFSNPTSYSGIYTSDQYQAISKLDSLDLTLSTPNLFNLPAGPVGFGVGAQLLHESEYIGVGGASENGLVLSPLIQSVNGERNVAAVYYQFDIPIIRTLSLSQSTRLDDYSDFGSAVSPRVALRWQPISQFTAYTSYTRGFRAPTLIENSNSSTVSAQYAVDPNDPTNSTGVQGITEVNKGNSSLKAERTRNIDVGFQLSPARNTDIGFDFYKIRIDNLIGTQDIQDTVLTNSASTVHRNANGAIAYVDVQYANVGTLDTDGFEVNLHKSLPTSYGTFSLLADWAYVWHFKVNEGGTLSDYAGNNGALNQPFGAAFPRWKGNTTLAWNYRKFNTSLTWEFTGPYAQAIGTTDSYPGMSNHVASYSQFNLYTSYSGFKNWTIYAGMNNMFNRRPPFDPVWQDYSVTGYDTSLYSYVGRYFQAGATYHF